MRFFKHALALLLLVAAVPLGATATNVSSITYSGFADTQAVFSAGPTTELKLSQLEVTLAAQVLPWLAAEATLAADGVDGVGLGAGTVTATFGETEFALELVAGRFDVPVGLASSWYGSPDNALPFGVLVNERLLGGWNNAGFLARTGSERLSFAVYAVDGAMASVTNADRGIAGGARLAWSPLDALRFGISIAANRHEAGASRSFAGIDAEFDLGPLTVSGEFLADVPEDTWSRRNEGFFGEARFDLADVAGVPLSLVSRYDSFSPDGGGTERAFSCGIAWNCGEALRLMLAYVSSDRDADRLAFQTLVMF